MAVIALGRFGVPELRDLPVIGFKIGLGNLLVAAPACSHHVQPETVLIGAVDGMSGMAIIANWKWLAEAAHALGMDAVLELVLDAVVAPAARVRHVVGVGTRRRIGSWKNLVSGVATGAGRGHRQPVLQQSPVNALCVVADDFMLQSGVAHGSLLTPAVTARAKSGNIHRKSRRLRVLFTKDSMRAVAFLAGRGIRITLAGQLSVDAGDVLLANFFVARGAVDSLGDGLARPHK